MKLFTELEKEVKILIKEQELLSNHCIKLQEKLLESFGRIDKLNEVIYVYEKDIKSFKESLEEQKLIEYDNFVKSIKDLLDGNITHANPCGSFSLHKIISSLKQENHNENINYAITELEKFYKIISSYK